MGTLKPFEAAMVGRKFTIHPYAPPGSPDITRYRVAIRTWSPRNGVEYTANRGDLIKLRDWINSAIIAEHSRTTRGSDEQ